MLRRSPGRGHGNWLQYSCLEDPHGQRSLAGCVWSRGLHGRMSYQAQHSTSIHGCIYVCVRAKSLQSCPTLCNPMDCSPQGSSFHGVLQIRILKWVGMPFLGGYSWPRDWTYVYLVSCTGRQVITSVTWEAQCRTSWYNHILHYVK